MLGALSDLAVRFFRSISITSYNLCDHGTYTSETDDTLWHNRAVCCAAEHGKNYEKWSV